MKQLIIIYISMFGFFYLFAADAESEEEAELRKLSQFSIEELMDINIISTSKTSKKLWEAPGIVVSYRGKDLKNMGIRTMADLFRIVAGVQVQRTPTGRSLLIFRGALTQFNNKVALFIDGVPVRNFFGEFPADEELFIDSIKKIEIIRGPGSALHGSNAFAGVISIYTFEPGEIDGGNAKISAGSNNSMEMYAAADYKTNFGNIHIEGRAFDSDGEKPRFDRYGNTVFWKETDESGEKVLKHKVYNEERVANTKSLRQIRLKAATSDNRVILSFSLSGTPRSASLRVNSRKLGVL